MASLMERKLIVVTGKGGTGKTTVACALGMLAARSGLRTIVVELGEQQRIPALFADEQSTAGHSNRSHNAGHSDRSHGAGHVHPGDEVELDEGLWSMSIDPDRALVEWLQALTGRLSARLLASSSTFHYFAAAAPGAKELVSMVKVRRLIEGQRSRNESQAYDLVVLDAPATGHALAMLSSPQTFAAIVRVGPLAEQAQGVRELLEDPCRSAYVAVAQGTEMAVTETIELEEGLRRHLDRDLDAVIVNGAVSRRFTRDELGRISTATVTGSHSSVARSHGLAAKPPGSPPEGGSSGAGDGDDARLTESAGRMARAVYERARLQQSQIARLRKQRFADGMPPSVVTIPFVFTPELDLAAVREISVGLERKL